MKFLVLLLLAATLAFAQPTQHSAPRPSAPRSEPRTSAPRVSAPKGSAPRTPSKPHQPPSNDRNGNSQRFRDNARQRARQHYNGRSFDRRFYRQHFGPQHPFYFYQLYWSTDVCVVNSEFFYNGIFWTLTTPCASMWPDYPWDVVYIEEDSMGDGFVLVNPEYPGITFYVNVVL